MSKSLQIFSGILKKNIKIGEQKLFNSIKMLIKKGQNDLPST